MGVLAIFTTYATIGTTCVESETCYEKYQEKKTYGTPWVPGLNPAWDILLGPFETDIKYYTENGTAHAYKYKIVSYQS